MLGDRHVDDPARVVREDDEYEEQPKVTDGTTKRSAAMIWFAWFVRNVRQVCDGGRGCRRMYVATVD